MTDRALNHVRNAFKRGEGEITRDDFINACERGGVYNRRDVLIVQATMESCGMRVQRGDGGRLLSTDRFIWRLP